MWQTNGGTREDQGWYQWRGMGLHKLWNKSKNEQISLHKGYICMSWQLNMKSCKRCYSRGYNADFSTGVRLKVKCQYCKGIGCVDWVVRDHVREKL